MESGAVAIINSFEVSLLFSAAMWGITSLQTITYYLNYKSDALLLKISIAVAWVLATIDIALIASGVHTIQSILINPDILERTGGRIPRSVISGAVVATGVQLLVQLIMVQSIYSYRIYKLTKKPYIPLLCLIGSSYSLASGIVSGVTVGGGLISELVQTESRLSWSIISWFVTAAVVDITITVTLSCYLLSYRRDVMNRTVRMIDRLVLWTIRECLCASVDFNETEISLKKLGSLRGNIRRVKHTGALNNVIPIQPDGHCYCHHSNHAYINAYNGQFCLDKASNVWGALLIILTNLYPLTMISLLNGRSALRPGNEVISLNMISVTQPGIVNVGLSDTSKTEYGSGGTIQMFERSDATTVTSSMV
ncbi:hypothetical protein AMATHDRAFT_49854 [Amanita thiersii Skay4041]|uniref:Uncharacterized protein n=1 Tax=Amanita thiersii Skay4041 TaxID=703135 RepID=A0A2A9NBM4_9AGAR|nr:hypothetical protein AMATHDRAFT_49854 [Amanita thiersii Skay4041]